MLRDGTDRESSMKSRALDSVVMDVVMRDLSEICPGSRRSVETFLLGRLMWEKGFVYAVRARREIITLS